MSVRPEDRSERPFRVQELLGIGLLSPSPEALADHIRNFLGLPATFDGERAFVRCDGLDHRVSFRPGAGVGLSYITLLLRDDEELETAGDWLTERGLECRQGTAQECSDRRVAGFVETRDPDGNSVALAYGPLWNGGPVPFPKRWTATSLGHLGLRCRDTVATYHFFRDFFGFKLSDQVGRDEAFFIRSGNGKHHSLALLPRLPSHTHCVDHVMFETPSIDDVMMAYYDMLEKMPGQVQRPVRHPPSGTTSVYEICPDGYRLELGFGHRTIDEATHFARTLDPVSFFDFWGGRATDPVQAG